jgi:hypothetical protein
VIYKLNNIFISKTKSFYNYITSTHCKDFKDEWEKFNNDHNEYFLSTRLYIFNFTVNKLRKKQRQSLENLYNNLRNNEFIAIKNYIFKEYSEEEKLDQWIKMLKNFAEYVENYTDPLFIHPEMDNINVTTNDNTTTLHYKYHDEFIFSISFEKTKIRKSNSTLFDTITGLDKDNVFSIVKINISNFNSKKEYTYSYIEDTFTNNNGLDDEICDFQLEYVKQKLDKCIYLFIGIVFDYIVNYELKNKYKEFRIFNSYDIKNSNLRELEEKWLENTNMESD